MSLTLKQIKFVNEYLVDGNATQAAIRAGYSEDTARSIASENLTKPYIIEQINIRTNEILEAAKLSQEWVLNRFKEISDRSMQAEPVLDSDGNPTGEYKYDSAGANKATENIAKYFGMLHQKVDITTNGNDITKTATAKLPDGTILEL